MAEIQAAISAKFLQVANAHKPSSKEGGESTGTLAAFFGVLESQLSKQAESADTKVLELPLATGLSGELEQEATDISSQVADNPAADRGGRLNADSVDALSTTKLSATNLPITTSANQDATEQPALLAVGTVSQLVTGLKSDVPAGRIAGLASTTLNKAVPEMLEKPSGSTKSGGLLKAGGAATAAASGQSLPYTGLAQRAQAELGGGLVTDAKGESVLATILSPQLGARGDAGIAAPVSSNAPIALTHSFEQVLRQAEAKVNASIEAPLRSPAFATELSEKVVWLVGRQGQFADLSLNPPQMGALEVRLSLNGGEVSAQFFSANPAVREAIDAALPRLRELMAQAGINLGDAGVRDQAFEGRQSAADARARNSAQEGDTMSHQAVMAGMTHIRPDGSGLVDLYI